MKTAFLLLSLFIGFQISAQNLGLTFGGGFGKIFGPKSEKSPYNDNEYQKQNTYRFGLEIKDIVIDTFFSLKFYVGFEQYGGQFYISDGGHGGGYTTQGSLTKNVFDIQAFPLNFRLYKRLTISAGLGMNIGLSKKLSGDYYSWSLNTNPFGIKSSTENLTEIDGYVRPVNYYLTSSLGYEINFKKFIIEPRYNFLLGISNEIDHLQDNLSSFRHSFTLSLLYKLTVEK